MPPRSARSDKVLSYLMGESRVAKEERPTSPRGAAIGGWANDTKQDPGHVFQPVLRRTAPS